MIQQHTTDVAGTPVRWLEQGSGTPVVLVHGIPTSPALWRHVMPRLQDMRVLAFEMTGYGQSIPAGRDRDLSVGAQGGPAQRLAALTWTSNGPSWSGTTSAAASCTSPRSGSPSAALGC